MTDIISQISRLASIFKHRNPAFALTPFTSQNRVGSKFGGGGVAGASETNVDRRERLRKIAMGVVDLNKVRRSHPLPTPSPS